MRKSVVTSLLIYLAVAIATSMSGAAHAAPVLADFERFPQNGAAYLPSDPDAPIVDPADQAALAEEYLERFFAPWHSEDLSFLNLNMEDVIAYHRSVANRQWYSPDGRPMARSSVLAVAGNGALDVNAVPRSAIIIQPSDVRVLPYEGPVYQSQASALGSNGLLKADMLQNSTAHLGEPAAVYGVSADSNWVFIATGTVVGWVRTQAVAAVNYDLMDIFVSSAKAVVTLDNVPVMAEQGNILYNMKMGTILPFRDGELLLPARGGNIFADVAAIRPPPDVYAEFPVTFTPRNAVSAIDQLMGEPYGWGGSNGFRDCSAMTRDYFSLFGVWLPRNSADQAMTGERVLFRDVPVGERRAVIADRGIPFATLLQVPGHIMLYIGASNGEPLVFHNMWGVSGQGEGRAVVGRAVVSGLRLGAEIPGKPAETLFVNRLAVMSFPTREPSNQ